MKEPGEPHVQVLNRNVVIINHVKVTFFQLRLNHPQK